MLLAWLARGPNRRPRHHHDDDTAPIMDGPHRRGRHRHGGRRRNQDPGNNQEESAAPETEAAPAEPPNPADRIEKLTRSIEQLDTERQRFETTYTARLADWNAIRGEIARLHDRLSGGPGRRLDQRHARIMRAITRAHRRWEQARLTAARFEESRKSMRRELRHLGADAPRATAAPAPPADEEQQITELRMSLRRQNKAWRTAIRNSLMLSDGGLMALHEQERLHEKLEKNRGILMSLIPNGASERRTTRALSRLHEQRRRWLENWRASEEVLQQVTRARDGLQAQLAQLTGEAGEGDEAPPVHQPAEA